MICEISELRRARILMDQMLALVQPDSLFERPIPPRHRIVFYIGHVEAFDRNLLGVPSVAPELDNLFAFGIDPPPGEQPSDGPDAWPEMAVVCDYRTRVREAVDAAWESVPDQLRHVAVEHRLMHAETFAYMIHGMDPVRLVRPNGIAHFSGAPPGYDTVEVPSGDAILGQQSPAEFGWDNEFPPQHETVPAFRIDRYPVTNADWLEFVRHGGTPPHFWRPGPKLRTLFEEIPLPLDWPVYVTHRQASEYAKWKGAVLPTEAQWQRAAYLDAPCGQPDPACGNFDSRRFDPEPVDANPEFFGGAGDMLGNGWEWTSSPFRPLPGFEPFPFYKGYSANFFDDDHFVLKGGSPRTDAKLMRPSFRNWFRSDYPYVYAKFRCIRNSH